MFSASVIVCSGFQSTLPARGATHFFFLFAQAADISIHAPRTGSDPLAPLPFSPISHFNPRSPHGERLRLVTVQHSSGDFNPRSPHGERRFRLVTVQHSSGDFNPRSPHGERHPPAVKESGGVKFQSTLPARGATLRSRFKSPRRTAFQSTLPARGATSAGRLEGILYGISIHAPRTGSDARGRDAPTRAVVISIHAPRTGSDSAK